MPPTYRDYTPWEIQLAVQSRPSLASGSELLQEGDIITMRRVHTRIGFSESTRFLWLRIQGTDANDMPFHRSLVENPDIDGDGPTFEKRQYSIPFGRLKEVVPWLDLTRVRDTTDAYQPFLSFDQDDYSFLPGTELPPLEVTGLVFDKATRRFF